MRAGRIEEDVVYSAAGRRALHADIYYPNAHNDQASAIILIHGGRWRFGTRKQIAEHAKILSERGFTAISIEYRFLDEAPWPAQLHDLKAAIRWTRKNAANLRIDPANVGLQGFSAGGQIALVAAGTPNDPQFEGDGDHRGVDTRVAAVAALYAPCYFYASEELPSSDPAYRQLVDFPPLPKEDGTVSAMSLIGNGGSSRDAKQASPGTYVAPDYPPCFVIHGNDDIMVPTSNSVRFYNDLQKAGVDSELHIYGRLNHVFDQAPSYCRAVQHEVALFFRRTISDKATIQREIEDNMPPMVKGLIAMKAAIAAEESEQV